MIVECINTEGVKQAIMIELEFKINSLRKIINRFAQQLEKKEGIPCVTNIVLEL